MASPLALNLENRLAGVLIPLFALRSDGDQGIGDLGDLRGFIDWAAATGFAVVQLLPINETGGDNSPYNAISSMALDPTTLELTPRALPDLSPEDHRAELASVDLAAMRAGPVDYSHVKPLKARLLRRAFDRFEAAGHATRRDIFEAFLSAQASWLDGYTLFRALMERNGGTECWDRWPADQQTLTTAHGWEAQLPAAERAEFTRLKRFYAYVQWVAYSQWEDLKDAASERGVAIMGDIPLGVSYYSADFFAEPHIFEPGWSGGAPPEPYFKEDLFTQKWGQNWGIPVYDWAEMSKDGFAWWRRRLSGVRDLFHVYRIDHILGFYRIYSFPWRPELNGEFLPLSAEEAMARTGGKLPRFKQRDDDTYENREANRREGEDLLRMVLHASGDTLLIGEDLGTVPEYVRPSLTSLGIAGFKIPLWEPDHRTGGLLPGSEYDRLSLATYGTHDHEPLRALWRRWYEDPHAGHHELRRLAHFAGLLHDLRPYDEVIHVALLEALYRSNSWLSVSMITDLFGSEERFNVPGTSANSNWSQRMPFTVEALAGDPAWQGKSAVIRVILERSGRELPAL